MAVPRRGAVEKLVTFVNVHLLIQIKATRALRYNKVNKWREDEMSRTKPTFDPLFELVLVGPGETPAPAGPRELGLDSGGWSGTIDSIRTNVVDLEIGVVVARAACAII